VGFADGTNVIFDISTSSIVHHLSFSDTKTSSSSVLGSSLTPFPVRSLSFFSSSASSSSDMLLSAGDDGQIYIWDAVNGMYVFCLFCLSYIGSLVGVSSGHAAAVLSVCASKDCVHFVSGFEFCCVDW
jgi:WD40 repeat protein